MWDIEIYEEDITSLNQYTSKTTPTKQVKLLALKGDKDNP